MIFESGVQAVGGAVKNERDIKTILTTPVPSPVSGLVAIVFAATLFWFTLIAFAALWSGSRAPGAPAIMLIGGFGGVLASIYAVAQLSHWRSERRKARKESEKKL